MKNDPGAYNRMPNMANAQRGFMNTARRMPPQGPMANAQAAQNMAAMQQQRGMAPQSPNRQMLAQALMRRFGGR